MFGNSFARRKVMSLLPLVIVNPFSAGGATGEGWPQRASDLRTHFGAFTCAFTEAAGDGVHLALRGAQEGRRLIVACGGDGTISEVANGILESGRDIELGLLPSGTGGDFRRTLNIPPHAPAAARALRNGRTRLIDVGRVTYQDYEGAERTRCFLGVASLGMSPEVIARVKKQDASRLPFNASHWLSGKISFAAATLQTTLAFAPITIKIQLDDKTERRLTVANLCVANARYFGGGMKIAPQAKLDDGLFDVVSIGDLGALEIIFNAHRLYFGTHEGLEQVHHTLAKRVEICSATSSVEVAIEVDGELLGRLPAIFEILPRALRVRCP